MRAMHLQSITRIMLMSGVPFCGLAMSRGATGGVSGGLSQHRQDHQTGASTSAREPTRASHPMVRAALASNTVFGGTIDRLKALSGAMHDVGGGEALREVLEE